ncbi:5-phosphomevalonate kinase, partial [Genlisea aurea]
YHTHKSSNRERMAVVVSAPGKVLMTGGYLILERPNAGIVLSTNARFYAIVKPLYAELKPDCWAWAWTDVKLTSPQMGREIMYKLSLKHLLLERVSSNDSRNPFVEYALQYSVAAAQTLFDNSKKDELKKLLLLGLDITVLGCNDFYSYRNQIESRGLPLTPDSLASFPAFSCITFNAEESGNQSYKPEVAKTGLGSSAAMTTAVVGALLDYLGVVRLPSISNKVNEGSRDVDIVHIVAQTAHCIAQGKIGSGFDVSSAVYGSQRYVRFSPEVISPAKAAVQGIPIEDAIRDVLSSRWDHERTSFSLPPLMTLLLGEPGSGGSSTPSMVGAVKKWRNVDPHNSTETWNKIAELNTSLELHLVELKKLAENDFSSYGSVIKNCSKLTPDKWTVVAGDGYETEVVKALLGAREAMIGIRFNMKAMGEAAGVPIEPDSQTRILDATMGAEGVVLGGVPGAGGFDAIFAVTLGDAADGVIKLWSWHNVLPLLVREDPYGIHREIDDPRASGITNGVSSL